MLTVLSLLAGFWFCMLGGYVARTDRIGYAYLLCSLCCLAGIVWLFVLEAIRIYRG